jgi:hypothetical protein
MCGHQHNAFDPASLAKPGDPCSQSGQAPPEHAAPRAQLTAPLPRTLCAWQALDLGNNQLRDLDKQLRLLERFTFITQLNLSGNP